jgi:hypothetical protein
MTNNEMKNKTLDEMDEMLTAMLSKLTVLSALDSDVTSSGCADLQDQLETMNKSWGSFFNVVQRAKGVVPSV